MGCIISAPIAFLGSCVGSCAGAMCCKALGSNFLSNRGAKIFYILIAFITAFSALLIRYQAGHALSKLALFSMNSCSTDACYETQGAYRVCMAMFIFFVITGVMTAASPSSHYGLVPLKILLGLALFIVSFLIPNDVANVYADICKFGAACFLLIQIVIFISMSYEWNTWWTESNEKPWLFATLVVSLTLWIGSIVISGFCYYWFGAAEQCGWQQGAITGHIVAACIYTLLGLSNFAPHGTLLTSSTIFAYGTYTLFGALAAEPSDCLRSGVSISSFNKYGLVIGAISLAWSALSVSRTTVFGQTTEPESIPQVEPVALESQHAQDKAADVEIDDSLSWPNIQFHILMALSALYMTMTITNWTNDINGDSGEFKTGSAVRWVALVTTWTSTVLYLWTLVAPRCCPNRDFGVEID